MVAECFVGPSQQRASPADGERPSKSVARGRKDRAGSARHGKGRRVRKGETGARENREKRKQLFARRLPLSHCNHCSSRSSNCSDSALAMTHTASTGMVDNETFYDIGHRNVDFMDGVNEFADLTQDVFAVTYTRTSAVSHNGCRERRTVHASLWSSFRFANELGQVRLRRWRDVEEQASFPPRSRHCLALQALHGKWRDEVLRVGWWPSATLAICSCVGPGGSWPWSRSVSTSSSVRMTKLGVPLCSYAVTAAVKINPVSQGLLQDLHTK